MVTVRSAGLAWAAAVVAVMIRLAIAWPGLDRPPDDPDNYLPLARSIADGRGFCRPDGVPTAYRPPLYPILLAPVTRLPETWWPATIAAIHAAIGGSTALLAASTARRWGLGRARSSAAALIVSLDPVLVAQSRSVMTETLAALLVAGSLRVLADPEGPSRRDAGIAGFLFGLSSLCRPSLLASSGLVLAAYAGLGPGTSRHRLIRCLIAGSALVATLTPWAVRNAILLGEPVWTTTHGGYTLALANNPFYYRDVLDGPPGAVWSGPGQRAWSIDITEKTAGMGEPDADRWMAREGWRMLRERPRDFARASVARLGRFWGIAPTAAVHGRVVSLLTAAWTAPFWLSCLAGLASPMARRWPSAGAFAAILGLSIVHTAFWTDMRMRSPIVPALALVASTAMARRGAEKN
ncbi:MAG: dolichyl-phosphate-mannose-protein mannosyltransferase [Isosphaeraceae bacterium]